MVRERDAKLAAAAHEMRMRGAAPAGSDANGGDDGARGSGGGGETGKERKSGAFFWKDRLYGADGEIVADTNLSGGPRDGRGPPEKRRKAENAGSAGSGRLPEVFKN